MPDDIVLDLRKKISAGTILSSVHVTAPTSHWLLEALLKNSMGIISDVQKMGCDSVQDLSGLQGWNWWLWKIFLHIFHIFHISSHKRNENRRISFTESVKKKRIETKKASKVCQKASVLHKTFQKIQGAAVSHTQYFLKPVPLDLTVWEKSVTLVQYFYYLSCVSGMLRPEKKFRKNKTTAQETPRNLKVESTANSK